jgi:hypothetical protein
MGADAAPPAFAAPIDVRAMGLAFAVKHGSTFRELYQQTCESKILEVVRLPPETRIEDR